MSGVAPDGVRDAATAGFPATVRSFVRVIDICRVDTLIVYLKMRLFGS